MKTEINDRKCLADEAPAAYAGNKEGRLSAEILSVCREIQRTVKEQPNRDEIKDMAKIAAREVLYEHEQSCFVRSDYIDTKTAVGRIEGNMAMEAPRKLRQSGKLVALGTVLGAAVPVGVALYALFF